MPCTNRCAEAYTSKTTDSALWSLPPFGMTCVSTAFRQEAKTLSMPQTSSTRGFEKTWGRWQSSLPTSSSHLPWGLFDQALKSPTRMTASPTLARSAMIFETLYAAAADPHAPPEFAGAGPWWLTEKMGRLLALCVRRTQITLRRPKYCAFESSATSACPCSRRSKASFR
uniref:Uncharacterized protein n=2 Tax=Alexandrium monilatum TaxID=311494 RepID=A0A7S4VLB3_9DINO